MSTTHCQTMKSTAYDRFVASMAINYDRWREGDGYDLAALEEMPAADRQRVAALLTGRTDWRDAEALERLSELGNASAGAAVQNLIDDERSPIEQRLIAMERLRDSGRLDDAELERRLLPALKSVGHFEGLTPALRLVEQIPTERIKRRLLWGVIHHPHAGVHYAAMLAYLCGKAESDFDWNLRPLFLATTAADPTERQRAIDELCRLVGMSADDAE